MLLAANFYEATIWLTGSLFLCVVLAGFLYFAWHWWMERNYPMFRMLVEVEHYEEEPIDIRPVQHLTLEQLLDEASRAKYRSEQIERAIWWQFGCKEPKVDTEEGMALQDKIVAAVYECRGWSDLLIEHYRYEKACKRQQSAAC